MTGKAAYVITFALLTGLAQGYDHFTGISDYDLSRITESWNAGNIKGCRTTKLDLVFVIDGSSDEFRFDFGLVRIWIQNMTSYFDVSPYTTRVAVVQSGDEPYAEFGFEDYGTTEEVIGAVTNLQYGRGFSTTGDTLRYVKDHVLNSARDEASKVVLVLSDGQIRKHNDVHKAAESLHDMGVTTFAIGAGEAMAQKRNVEYLKAIASHPMEEHLFRVRSLRSIGILEKAIISEVCEHTVQECPTASHDLAFIIDGSSTIGYNNFRKVKEWMKKIVESFDVGNAETRIAVIQYSNRVQEEIRFDDNLTKTEILEKIDAMELMSGDTHTGYALEYCMKVIFSSRNGARSNIPDVAIVMTDGKAQDHVHVVTAAEMLHDAGIEVYAMGVANYSLTEVQDIASDPDENHVILAPGFAQIDLKRIGLIKSICEESEPGCPSTAADIVFLVDNTVTYGSDNLQNAKAWMKNIVDSLEVGPHYSRVGLVRYAAYPELVFGLSAYSSTAKVIKAISDKLRHENGPSATARAIDYVTGVVFNEARPNVPKFLIVLTEGNSHDDVTPAAIRAKAAGIETFTFGVGDVNLYNLRQIASGPDHVFNDYTFDGIRRKHSSFLSVMCGLSEPACETQEIDLQFLVDGSSSIQHHNFEKVKTWIRNVIRSFDIGNYLTRVGLVQYSSTIRGEFGMNTFKTKREIEHAVQNMQFMGGVSHTGAALDHILEHSFSEKLGSRNGAAKVLVIVSDGNSEDSVTEAAGRIHEAGIRVFAVGAGSNTDRQLLDTMATEPVVSHVTESASYDAINTVRQQLVGEICRETRTDKECPEAEMDLIFLVDGSTSIGANSFEMVKNWMISFIERFEIGEYNSKIGVVQYSDTPRLEVNLKSVSDKKTLTEAIGNIQFISGTGYTGAALNYIRTQEFLNVGGARAKAPKVVIVLTNGISRDAVGTPAQVLHDQGVIIYSVGVGDVDQSELRSIASSDDNVLHVRNYDTISTIQSSLVRRVCQRVQYDCRENATDIVMLIDGSNSVGYQDWEVVKSFMRNITERFHIGPTGVQVGVVQYATDPKTEFYMKDFGDISSLQRSIDEIEWMKGDTHTAQALRFVREESLTRTAGARGSNVSKILIVVTDGEPQDSDEVPAAAQQIHADGWRVFAIGVGQATIPELNIIASDPDYEHVFYADNFESTRKLKGRLFRMICTEYIFQYNENLRNSDDLPAGPDADPNGDFNFTPGLDTTGPNDETPTPNGSDDGSEITPTGPGGNTDDGGKNSLDPDMYPDANSDQSKSPDLDIDTNGDSTSDLDVPELVDEFDISSDDPNTLELKEPKVENIGPDNITALLDPDDLDFDVYADKKKDKKNPSRPGDLVALPRAPVSLNVGDVCSEIRRNDRTMTKGWDFLVEMGIKKQPKDLKPKRSTLIERIAENSVRLRVTRTKPGSKPDRASHRLTPRLGLFAPLSSEASRVLKGSWSFIATFRMHGSTCKSVWSLLNMTNELGNSVLSISFNGKKNSLILHLPAPSGVQNIVTFQINSLFDKGFHKLEIVIEKSKVFVRVDCVTLLNEELLPPSHVSELLTAVVVSSEESDQIIVDVQEMILKCAPGDEEQCCDLPGKPCVSDDPTPEASPKSLEKCVCPPGPQGPQGPPGKVLKRGARGRPGPRGPPGKASCPPITKSTAHSIAKKVATNLINEEFRTMYQVLLDSVREDGGIDKTLIQATLEKYEYRANSATQKPTGSTRKRAHHKKSARKPLEEDDCGDVPCDTIPADILDEV